MPTIADIVMLSPTAKASTASKPHQALTIGAPVGVATQGAASASTGPAVASMPARTALAIASADEPTLGRLLLNPYRIDAGYVLTDQALTITAWNSNYAKALNITSVENTDPDALQLTGNQARRLAPGEATTYAVQLRVVGKHDIDDHLRFVVAELGTNSPSVRLFGTRLVVFPLSPDWSAGVEEEVRQATSLLTTYSGMEQRALLQADAVRSLTFSVNALTPQEAGLLDAFLWAWQARVFGVPEWQRAVDLTASAGAGSKVVVGDTRYANLAAGDYVMVFEGADHYDVNRVAEATSNQITLAFELGKSYSAGARVLPISFARVSENQATNHATAGSNAARLTFTIEQ